MRISRLGKIKNHRIFRDFVWPGGLAAFDQFNVIYGWNGSGKTTLSSLFGHLQSQSAITEGEVEFELDNGIKITGCDIPLSTIPSVRVFNRDFVFKTIEAIGKSNVAPIYFLGAESIVQQKQVEELKRDLAAARESVIKADKEKVKADKALDEFSVEKARLIKEALLGSALYANYDKRRFREAIVLLKAKSPQPLALTDKEKEGLRKKKELQAKPSITKVELSLPDAGLLRSRTVELLERSIMSKVIDGLARDPVVGSWVQHGLSLHKGSRETEICHFCGNELSPQRREELEAHFNDAFASFQREIQQTISDIERHCHILETMAFPDESRFYDHLTAEIHSAVVNAKQAIKAFNGKLNAFKGFLEKKKATPFEAVLFEDDEPTLSSSLGFLSTAIDAINSIIDKHESIAGTLNVEIRQACQALEQDYVLDALPKFEVLNNAVAAAETALSKTNPKPGELETQISGIEVEIREHRRPAEELNRELHAYLGRGELKFEVKDTGYALSRGGKPALHLSEGERTAIAFLYFLKSLEDKAFDLSKGIVVIDDPVSSLDANALFSAFGYMKERTKACHQLFILTHNFSFFRQVKNWFHHLKKPQKPGRFYALLTTISSGERSAELSPIDPLLEKFESEYHFLFRQVHDVANSAALGPDLAQYYGMPNIARRLIETFLAYRFPDCSGNLSKSFDRATFDASKKTRILRLLHTYSHSGGISDPEHDPSVLAETQDVMKIILELIQTLDDGHYQGMVKLIQPVEAEG